MIYVFGSRLPIWTGVGASLVAAGIAGCMSFLYVWLGEDERERIKELRRSGLSHIFESRSSEIREQYNHRLKKASSAIDIMGFGLRHLLEDHAPDFEQWARKFPVRFLVIDPEFPSKDESFAAQRNKEEGDHPGQIESDVKKLVSRTKMLRENGDIKFQIRLYRCLPSINIFRIDDDVYWGPYFVGKVSRNMPTLLLEGNGFLTKEIRRHFDEIWTSEILSRDIPSEWLD